jgi:ketosteroid isomerase-like protein
MKQENLDLVRGPWERYRDTGHLDDLVGATLAILADDVEVRDHDVPDAPLHEGREGYLRWLQIWGEAWEKYTIDMQEYIDAGDRVVVVFRLTATGKGSGLELDRIDAIVHTVREGKLAKLDYYNNKQEALEAAGLTA